MQPRHSSAEIGHVGGGTTLLLSYAALIPGFVPTLALLGVITAVALVPFLVLGLVGALLAAPPFLMYRLARRNR